MLKPVDQIPKKTAFAAPGMARHLPNIDGVLSNTSIKFWQNFRTNVNVSDKNLNIIKTLNINK